ncbi:MAG: alpha/beta hydrolase [Oleiphilaceae bacterium]|nr:alpha/beta hydrolase [Oleiphilaceae bacterium]
MSTLLNFVLVAGGLYLALTLLLFLMQSRLIHQPGGPLGREVDATPSDVGLRWEEVRLNTADDVRLHGWYLPAQAAIANDEDPFTLLFFHGNAGNISHRLETLEIFHALGLATLIIDYRGYGRSEGKPSEAGLYQDADTAWRYLVEQRRLDPQRVIAFGRSLGAPVAAHLAAERKVAGLILESAFTSAPDRGAEIFPVFPVKLIATVQYPTKKWVRQTDVPVLVIHSENDEIIPFHHGKAVYEAAPEPKAFIRLEGGHNTGFLISRATYMGGLTDWLDTYLKASPPSPR